MALFKKTLVYMFLWATFGKIGLLFIPTSVLKSNHEKTRFTKFKSVVFNAKSLINFGRLKCPKLVRIMKTLFVFVDRRRRFKILLAN